VLELSIRAIYAIKKSGYVRVRNCP
jgi:hypothetical protein